MANISKFRANLKHINQIAVMHRETERVETNPAAQHVSQTESTRDRWRKRGREETMGSPVEIRNYDTFGQTDSTLKYVIRELERERERLREHAA